MATPAPHDVFTPRGKQVNPEMYVSRPELEDALVQALPGAKHIVIHGESGSGKSWLYQQVLKKLGLVYEVANLANASRNRSIGKTLLDVVARDGSAQQTGYERTTDVTANAVFAKSTIAQKGQFEYRERDPFELCFEWLNAKAKGEHSFLIFDNLESIFSSPDLLRELADLIVLCDDPYYSKFNVKLIIVGVPSSLKDYYYTTPNHQTVSNRLTEIPEVARLTKKECFELARKGFSEQLQLKLEQFDQIQERIAWYSDRVPQQVHEFCLELATAAVQNHETLTLELVPIAVARWIHQTLHHSYTIIESHMNVKDTKAGRRNQTIYALGQTDSEQVKASEIETLLRSLFPSTGSITLNIAAILSQLSSGDMPILRRSPKGDAFQFADPRLRMVIRAVLLKNSSDKIERLSLTRY